MTPPARKGDGTGLSFNGYQEVRKADGTVLWSADAIPNSEVLESDGTWSVHQRPRAIHSGSHTYIGSIDSGGTIQVTDYDHTDGSTTTGSTETISTIDDHSSPSIYLNSDGNILAMWTRRSSDDSTIYYSLTQTAGDVTSFGTVQTIVGGEVDYPEIVPYNGDLRVYYREQGSDNDTARWKYRVSTDKGETWSEAKDFVHFDGEDRIYIHVVADASSDRIHFALGDHRMANPGVYHWYLENGTYYTSDGTVIQDETSGSGGFSNEIDGFEDGDLSEYTKASGDGTWEVSTSSPVLDGDFSAKVNGEGGSPQIQFSASGDGLDNYPSKGGTFYTGVYVDNESRSGHMYGGPDADNTYFARINTDSNNLQFYKYNGGGATLIDEVSQSFSTSQWYVLETQWGTDNTHTHSVYETDGTELVQISGSDSDHDSGGYGLYTSTSNSAAFDGASLGSFDGGSSGGEITSLSDLTTVYDSSDSGNNPAKQYDLEVDANGNPHIAFTEHVSTGSGGGDGDYRARWAGWNGSGWDVGAEITAMGGALPETHYYEGGIGLDSVDPTTVYVSVEQSNRNYQIQEWTTEDSGSSWTKVRDLSGDGAVDGRDDGKRGRPISPRDHDSDMAVLWWAGIYDYFTDYDTEVVGWVE